MNSSLEHSLPNETLSIWNKGNHIDCFRRVNMFDFLLQHFDIILVLNKNSNIIVFRIKKIIEKSRELSKSKFSFH